MNSTAFEIIEKEAIGKLRFPNTEVLSDVEKIKERNTELQRACSLGNLEHTKIRILFEDDQQARIVETTVWAVTDKRVILKHGLVIPIQRILSIRI